MMHRWTHHLDRAHHTLRRPLAACIGGLGTIVAVAALGTGFAACSASTPPGPVVTTSTNPAAVSIDLRDGNDNHMGSCSGTLVSPSVVLTAGHCVVAMGKAVIVTGDGRSAVSTQVWTSWQNFDSTWSHPLHSDVALILLDKNLPIASYPTITTTMAPDGQTLSRMRRADALSTTGGNYEQVTETVHLGAAMGFPYAYTMDAAYFEGLTDTGGALMDGNGVIYGVVSGKGTTSGQVYVSSVDYLASWIANIAPCPPPPVLAQCHPSGSSSGGSSSSGSSGGSGSSGSSGGNGSSGSSSGGWSSSGAGSSSGSSGGSSSGSGGYSSSGGGGDDGGTCNPGPPPPPPPCTLDDGGTSSGSSGGVNGSSSGNVNGSSSGGVNGSSGVGGSNSSGGIFGGPGGSSSSGGTPGSSNGSSGGVPIGGNVPLVPDGPGCTDSTCGGCADDPACQDGQTDYGDCGCEPGPTFEAGPTQ
jgi:hypothetical protein